MKQWLENALNRYVALDAESKHRLALLRDKRVTLEFLSTPFIVQLFFAADKIQLIWDADALPEADIIIRGTPLNLLHMSVARHQRTRFFAEDVRVEGNMELAQAVLNLFDDLEVDWEEQLSRWMGDVPAHHVGRMMRDIKTFSKRVRYVLLQNTNEYVHEEINLFPPAEELNHFLTDVDELRMDVDRLEARMERLKADVVGVTQKEI